MSKIFRCPHCQADLALSWDHEKSQPVIDVVGPPPEPHPEPASDESLLGKFFNDKKTPS